MEIILSALLGMVTGLTLGITGAGAGIVAAPLLLLVLHQPIASAVSISLLSVAIGSLVGTLMGLRAGLVRYRAALLLSITGLLLSPLGVYLSHKIPATPLLLLFSVLLVVIGAHYWRGKTVQRDDGPVCEIDPTSGRFIWNGPCLWSMSKTGMAVGFLSGLLGVGGGFILVPALRRHSTLPMKAISATSLMVLTIVSTGSLLQWLSVEAIHWEIALPFIVGIAAGTATGRLMVHRISDVRAHHIFGGLCLIVGAALVVKALASL
jgi:uncharacterized membrane protein YfcA